MKSPQVEEFNSSMKYKWGFLETGGYLEAPKARVCSKVDGFVPRTQQMST